MLANFASWLVLLPPQHIDKARRTLREVTFVNASANVQYIFEIYGSHDRLYTDFERSCQRTMGTISAGTIVLPKSICVGFTAMSRLSWTVRSRPAGFDARAYSWRLTLCPRSLHQQPDGVSPSRRVQGPQEPWEISYVSSRAEARCASL